MTTPIDISSEEKNLDCTEQRKLKLEALRTEGNPFPNHFRYTHLAQTLHQKYDALDNLALEERKLYIKVAGRIMLKRVMGKASFLQLQDTSGKIQLYLQQNILSPDIYQKAIEWDLGDIIGAEGFLFKTKTGELSIKVQTILLLTKALHPFPDKFHGLSDQELRYRQRYLDLLLNPETRKTFQIRSQIIQEIRNFFIQRDFVEVETPMMQILAGGANAKPFITHHNALNMPLYLRIAPELYLKRLVIGGLDRVFEINRNFRNEGISTKHNPEFTMIEFYQAFADYKDFMELTEDLLRILCDKILHQSFIEYQGKKYDFSQPFARFTLEESIHHYHGAMHTIGNLRNLTEIRQLADSLQVPYLESEDAGIIQLNIFEKTIEPLLEAPTFITAYPTSVSPLSRQNDQDPFITDRFELFIAGCEIANGFSELNDPQEQAHRFLEQAKMQNKEECMAYDQDYIHALGYGLPPTAGEGIGIDRLVMLFTDKSSIKDVILFPLLKPKPRHHE